MALFWLSFADDDNGGFLGACIVDATDFLSAVAAAHVLKCNPGGECLGWEFPDCPESRAEVDKWGIGKLITREMLAKAGGYVRASDGKDLTP